jgi:hypothetical protein
LAVFQFDPRNYGETLASVLDADRLCELGPGKPNAAERATLSALDLSIIFGGQGVTDRNMASCCLAGIWLLHNFLDESHSISQDIDTPTGSFWHGILHRREPDFSNAKYWFRRVGQHEIYPALSEAARDLASSAELDNASRYLLEQTTWDPMRFVDLCEAVTRGRSSSQLLCRRIAQCEWRLLFDHCYRRAIQ